MPTDSSPRRLQLYDAHNHAHDCLARSGDDLWGPIQRENIHRMVVNGSCEADWEAVLSLARQHPEVIPSFGYHPWHLKERSPQWQERLVHYLDQLPSTVGEIGLDRWIKDHDIAQQQEVFCAQLRIASERNLPVSIHCLQAWGLLFDLLRANTRPACGFVLHSFGGPKEMIGPLGELGAYFSLPGYFAHERKARQREAFRHVPIERLLLETDAPDQPLPAERVRYAMTESATGTALNHPGNLGAVYAFAAELLECPLESLAATVEENFRRLFGRLAR